MLYGHWSDLPTGLWRWRNFAPDEPNLACPCCGEFFLDEVAMDRLQHVRDLLGRPIKINSGHRCPIHNARVGGAPMSRHKLEIAFDISLAGQDPRALFDACREAGFSTFGFYGTFLHTDTRPGRRWFTKAGRTVWQGVI